MTGLNLEVLIMFSGILLFYRNYTVALINNFMLCYYSFLIARVNILIHILESTTRILMMSHTLISMK